MASIAMGAKARPMTAGEKKVIFASSLGTVFEWYDFYLYGSLAAIIAKQFFAGLDAGSAFIFALLAFAAGFIVRPFGALLFGRLGDMIGRKYTFLVTILIMGLSTFIVGVLPNYAAIGAAAPVILIALRLLQGLALGGEYGGAATYVAEHAPANKRGAYTSWIQTTATLGLFLSLLVILGTRTLLGEDAFNAWGWRVPFLVSIALLAVSVWIRLKLNESPAFIKMKADGKASKAPLTEAFARWGNLKYVILALLGLVAGQAVVWYTGQFYALFFLTQTLKVDAVTANLLIAAALLIGTPFFVVFGSLSDKIGRKPIILAGCAIAALTYFPLFQALTHYANPALYRAVQNSPVTLTVDQSQCTFQFNPTGTAKFTSSCDIAKQMLAANSANYNTVSGTGPAVIQIGDKTITVVGAKDLPPDEFKAKEAALKKEIGAALKAAGYPAKADPAQMNLPMVIAILALLVIFVTMVYGPIAAALVELFPTRIRYTSMSLPYHIGNGWFGGLLPTIAFALVAQNGNIYYGLWYPVIIAAGTFVIGLFFLPETKDRDIYAAD
ncbi:General substrate transporter [Thiomonas arsenitoxydans]|jgi:MFS family permease|uniref:General substrate transporter n=2 Tax=Thiomonas TaxID=32012 RepID=D6CNH2_THIA3|nr:MULTISPECIES: MFS transporter [Thiomonas]MDE2175584.1 MHS family MFS transporter [Betaproteobacteria bacterium]MBN8744829.1 MHS family MFS transporter [Thiomonas arsenitoxydans]ODU95602.1 MAG: MFS transporter [Thiomonas sp. SCN 64-16]CAZ90100.1 putative shikimate transporter [Thiomonas arsenitoxydans]CQR37010.1 General substrate transporter [Thiomonas arsenitoxydans]